MPCNSSLAAIFTADALENDMYGAFDSFVNDHCTKNMDFRVPSKSKNQPSLFKKKKINFEFVCRWLQSVNVLPQWLLFDRDVLHDSC